VGHLTRSTEKERTRLLSFVDRYPDALGFLEPNRLLETLVVRGAPTSSPRWSRHRDTGGEVQRVDTPPSGRRRRLPASSQCGEGGRPERHPSMRTLSQLHAPDLVQEGVCRPRRRRVGLVRERSGRLHQPGDAGGGEHGQPREPGACQPPHPAPPEPISSGPSPLASSERSRPAGAVWHSGPTEAPGPSGPPPRVPARGGPLAPTR
jgi:hypothetical protein